MRRVVIRAYTCPICNAELPPGATESRWFPFCGERCRNVDLYRWGRGKYAIVEPLLSDEDAGVGMADDPDPEAE
jgi:endogenous inhibitor of DNA gyrase (YacG/DUF329 family)